MWNKKKMYIKNLVPSSLKLHSPIAHNAKWYIEYYTLENGIKKRHRPGFGLNRIKDMNERMDEAVRIVNVLKLVNEQNTRIFGNKIVPVGKAIDLAIQIKENRTDRKKSIVTYSSIANIFVAWMTKQQLINVDVKLIDRKVALSFLDYAKSERQVSAKTHNNYISILRNIFNILLDRELVDKNPFSKITELRETETTRKALSTYERKLIMTEIRNTGDVWLEIAVLFIYYTLLRPIELRRMRFKDVDLQKAIIILSGEQTKNRKTAGITMTDVMIERLINLDFHKWDPNLLIFGAQSNPHLYKPIGEHTLNNRHRKILERLKDKYDFDYTGISLYSWKDTGATDLLDEGLTIDELRQHIRHEDLKDTQKYLKKFKGVNPHIRKISIKI